LCRLSAKGAFSLLVRHRTDSPWRTWGIAQEFDCPRAQAPKAPFNPELRFSFPEIRVYSCSLVVRRMTSTQIRQSFLDFFREKQHTIVRSSLLLPDAPNLLFTNAGITSSCRSFWASKKLRGNLHAWQIRRNASARRQT
jgi:hypothetical protein